MAGGISDAVRTYQLPTSAPGQPFASPTLAPNMPIYFTAGLGAQLTAGMVGQGLSPPVQTGFGHFDITITSYMEQASNEAKEETQ